MKTLIILLLLCTTLHAGVDFSMTSEPDTPKIVPRFITATDAIITMTMGDGLVTFSDSVKFGGSGEDLYYDDYDRSLTLTSDTTGYGMSIVNDNATDNYFTALNLENTDGSSSWSQVGLRFTAEQDYAQISFDSTGLHFGWSYYTGLSATSGGPIIINDASASGVDFRVETNTDTHSQGNTQRTQGLSVSLKIELLRTGLRLKGWKKQMRKHNY